MLQYQISSANSVSGYRDTGLRFSQTSQKFQFGSKWISGSVAYVRLRVRVQTSWLSVQVKFSQGGRSSKEGQGGGQRTRASLNDWLSRGSGWVPDSLFDGRLVLTWTGSSTGVTA